MATTILLIEDNKDMRGNLAEMLTMEGYSILEAENGKIGLEQIISQHPDLIICDISMPMMSGLEVLKATRTNEAVAATPFIILSAYSDRVSESAPHQPDEVLTKPTHFKDLLKVITRYAPAS